jgi:hypothetical protein
MKRIPRVVAAQTRPPHVLIVCFDDGQIREIDMKGELWGTMFESLKDPGFFARVRVDEERGTVVWPNGVDLDPETLYDPSLRERREAEAAEAG